MYIALKRQFQVILSLFPLIDANDTVSEERPSLELRGTYRFESSFDRALICDFSSNVPYAVPQGIM